MQKVIYKYTIPRGAREHVENMPWNSKVLTAQVQAGNLVIWAECDPRSDLTEFRFFIRNTGQKFDQCPVETYIGTVQAHGGDTIKHVYYTRK